MKKKTFCYLGLICVLVLGLAVSAWAAVGVQITEQPQNCVLADGLDATFHITATGSGNIGYQWYTLQPVLAVAGDMVADQWAPNEDAVWQSQIQGQKSTTATLSKTISVMEHGVVLFDWKVDSESDCDILSYTLTGPENQLIGKASISGEKDWASIAHLDLPAGDYLLTIQYEKDGSVDSGTDSGYIRMWSSVALEGATANICTVAANSEYAREGQAFYCLVTDESGSFATSDMARLVKEYTVTFLGNGTPEATVENLPEPVSVSTGDLLASPSKIPTREGFVFAGWYQNAAGTQGWDFAKNVVTKDIALYAKWKEAVPLTSAQQMAEAFASIDNQKAYVLENDIDFTDFSGPWPDGIYLNTVLDGQGHCLQNWQRSEIGKDLALFYGIAGDGVVRNLNLASSIVWEADSIAGIAGHNDGRIENCRNEASYIVQESAWPFCASNNGEIINCVDNCTITVADPAGYTISDGVMAYLVTIDEDDMDYLIDVKGKYHANWLQTTYGNEGFGLTYDNMTPDQFTLTCKPGFTNKGNFVRLAYTIKAKQDIIDGKLAVHADIQIGSNDDAPISVLKNDNNEIVGLKMIDDEEGNNSYGAQFNLYFRNTANVTDVSTYWFGEYSNRLDNCYNQIEAESLTDTDSGVALSWQGISLPAGAEKTFSVLVGIGSAAAGDVTAHRLTYDEPSGLVSYDVLDEAAIIENGKVTNPVTIFYQLDDGEEQEITSFDVVLGDNDIATYTFPMPVQITEDGFHRLQVWAMNEGGAITAVKELNLSQWHQPTYTIKGKVESENPAVQITEGTILLQKGATLIAKTVCDENGAFVLEKVPAGVYNLVITDEKGNTVTLQLEVTGDIENGSFALPDGSKNSFVEIKENTPPVVVGGLNEIFTNTQGDLYEENALYEAADQEIVAAGGKVEITLVADSLPEEEVAAAAKESIQAKLLAKEKVVYLDFSLLKKVIPVGGADAPAQPLENITTPILLQLTVSLPQELQNKASYAVYRYHDGQTDLLTTTPNADGEKIVVSSDKKSLTVWAKKFSTYAIAYTEKESSGSSHSGGGNLYYEITATTNGGGSILPNSASVVKNSAKTFTITADTGYEIVDVIVDGKSVGVVSSYTFTNVNKDHHLEAVFQAMGEKPTDSHLCAAFQDIDGHWAQKSICYMVENGYMQGTGETAFAPNEGMSRAMVVTVLWRMQGKPQAQEDMLFTDCVKDSWYHQAVAWATEQNIVEGVGENRFEPERVVSRQELAAILFRFAQSLGKGPVGAWAVQLTYNDAGQIADYAVNAAMFCQIHQLIEGKPGNLFAPIDTASRAEVAVILERLQNNIIKEAK